MFFISLNDRFLLIYNDFLFFIACSSTSVPRAKSPLQIYDSMEDKIFILFSRLKLQFDIVTIAFLLQIKCQEFNVFFVSRSE